MIARRAFLGIVGSSAALWPIAARGQASAVPSIGILMGGPNDRDGEARVSAFRSALVNLGHFEGLGIRFEIRWALGNEELLKRYARELVSARPQILLAGGFRALSSLHLENESIPVVFVASDPVAGGLIESMRLPDGNMTGFNNSENAVAEKLLDLLMQAAPNTRHVGYLFHPDGPASAARVGSFQSAAISLGVVADPFPVRDAREIEQAITALARSQSGGLLIPPAVIALANSELIIRLANQHKLPTIYPYRSFVASGGLFSYGADITDLYTRAGSYAYRIMKGERPGSLPVQNATKYNLVFNLKTAKALGLIFPPSLLARADEVIE
jgi:putative ABC transport system substrate-binding protein